MRLIFIVKHFTMERYIHLFETEAEFNEARQNNYYEPWVSYTEASERVDYNEPDWLKVPLTFQALGSGNVSWTLYESTLLYSKNGGAWTEMNSGTSIPVVSGDEIKFKGTNTSYQTKPFSSTAQFILKGNIMSITNGDDFENADATTNYMFDRLFQNCTSLISANKLQLPATTIQMACYYGMFSGCTSLTAAPQVLPATTVGQESYNSMFKGCTSLTSVPDVLPARTLASSCYSGMFSGCSSLTKAPALPATALQQYCYSSMFSGCTSLAKAPVLPAINLAQYCYSNMFNGCTELNYIKAMFKTNITASTSYTNNWVKLAGSSTGTFVKNSEATWNLSGWNGVPDGWTIETASA